MTSKLQSERKSSAPQQQPAVAPHANSVSTRGTVHSNPQHYTFNHNSQQKMPRRSSKPFINWFQRKLSGTVKRKRSDTIALGAQRLGRNGSRGNSSRANGRIVPSPVPNNSAQFSRQRDRLDVTPAARRKTVSLNSDDDFQSYNGTDSAPDTLDRLSMARDSLWSPASIVEADDDASLRPLPPSAPPSPVPSRSSSSYLSDPRTFRSIAASTKPTTLLSIDLPGNGMAHIAQVPVTSSHRFAHMRQSSSSSPHAIGNAAVIFSALQSQSQSPPPTSQSNYQIRVSSPMSPVQAPLHTTHHPRNNPRPSSPPLDNASLLTLASSAYALPVRSGRQIYSSSPPSAFSGGDSTSHFGGGSMLPDVEGSSLFVGGEDAADERDASVRALRPRSSRRGSWGSELSGWSAQILQVPETPNRLSSDETNTENGRDTQENLEEADDGADTDTSPQSHSVGDSRIDDSLDTSHVSTDDSAVQCEHDTSVRACYRSASLDTVGQDTTDKDLSTAMSSFGIVNEEKSASD